jgi:hypothetical protein
MTEPSLWPDLPLSEWSETCETLHRWTQIAGKVQMESTPLVNHWWNVVFHVTSRGLATSPIPHAGRTFDIIFDFIEHRLFIQTSDGGTESLKLAPMSVMDFYFAFMDCLRRLDIEIRIWTMPSEIENAAPFDQDRIHAQYDPEFAERFWRALLQVDRLFKVFRARFIGKASPVHFFWGSFDLAVTRFSGRRAPPPKGRTPNVAPWVMSEAYSHEVSSCGFWPGNGGYGQAAFYVYAYIPSRRAIAKPSCVPPKPSTTTVSVNSFCRMMRSAGRPIRTPCCSPFCKRHMNQLPGWRCGIGKRSSAPPSCVPGLLRESEICARINVRSR